MCGSDNKYLSNMQKLMRICSHVYEVMWSCLAQGLADEVTIASFFFLEFILGKRNDSRIKMNCGQLRFKITCRYIGPE